MMAITCRLRSRIWECAVVPKFRTSARFGLRPLPHGRGSVPGHTRAAEPLKSNTAILHMLLVPFLAMILLTGCTGAKRTATDLPFVVVLGTGQDGGIPQAGSFDHPGWTNPRQRRMITCLGLIDRRSGRQWLFDATPDFRRQLYELQLRGTPSSHPPIDGIFLTHAHIGHYTGLMFLGHESMGADGIPVYAMPRMKSFLETNGPWDQLVRLNNIDLHPLAAGTPVSLADDISVTPILVPHRQEYSEVVAYKIDGPRQSILFMPDIDSWSELDETGTTIESLIAQVDVAYLDGTFFANGEIPGRDMSGFPHPFISHSIERFSALPEQERNKVRFIHLNHTNPAQRHDSEAYRAIHSAGMDVALAFEMCPL